MQLMQILNFDHFTLPTQMTETMIHAMLFVRLVSQLQLTKMLHRFYFLHFYLSSQALPYDSIYTYINGILFRLFVKSFSAPQVMW